MYQRTKWSGEKETIVKRVWNWIVETYKDIRYSDDKISKEQVEEVKVFDCVFAKDGVEYSYYWNEEDNKKINNMKKSIKAKNQKRDISGRFCK